MKVEPERNNDSQEYKTPEEQVDLLLSRDLEFLNKKKSEKILSKVNYYNLLNPYGKPFQVEKDLYMKGATFEQIYGFYKFDKNMSYLFLSYILYIESSFKTAISHVISSKGKNGHKEESYLDISIFNDNRQKTDEELQDDQELLNILKNRIKNSTKLYIKHNRHTYKNVPFWVLCNEMDFGETIYYFEKLPEKDRNKISLTMRDENKEVKLNLNQFRSALYMLKDLRNLIAHNEVFYWFKPIRFDGKDRWYGFNNYKEVKAQRGSIATVMLIFNMYLSPEDWNNYYEGFKQEYQNFVSQVPDSIIQKILNDMGFFEILGKKYNQDIISLSDIYHFYH